MRLDRVAALALVGLALPGCAAWQDHNEKTADARRDFERGDFDGALAVMAPEKSNKLDGLCFQLDSGVVAQVGGKFDRSNQEFEAAESTIQGFEDRGLTGSVIAEEIGSIAVNEKTIPYKGEDFEKVLVPVFRARNYLLAGQMEDAMVEARKIWTQQDIVKQLHEKELRESEAEADKNNVDRSKLGEVEGKVEYPQDALKSPESVYEITYAHYLSALIAEKRGDVDNALIAMKSAAKIRPDLEFVERDVMRLAHLHGSPETVQEIQRAFPKLSLPGRDEGSIALLFDCGWAPHKKELKILLPSFSTFGAIAIPLYERTHNPAAFARLVLNDRVYATRVLSDVDAIAFKYHRLGLATRVLKQILRATIKIAAGEAAAAGTRYGTRGQRGSGVAGLAAGLTVGVYNYVSEQADLRAWLTLPQTFQAVRAWVPAGTYETRVELCDANGNTLNAVSLGTVTVRPRSLQFISARSLHRSLFAAVHKEFGAPLPARKVETPPPPRPTTPPPPKVETPPPPPPTPKVEEPPPPPTPTPKPEEPKARKCPGCGRSILDPDVKECPDCATPLDGSPKKAPETPKPEEPKPETPKPETPKPEETKPEKGARTCPGCGDTILDPNVKECPACGTPLKKD